jgi:peptidoglycan hydrolase-like protein with peptidoglycan-binding domain
MRRLPPGRAAACLAVLVLTLVPAGATAAPRGDTAALQVALGAIGLYAGTIDGVAGPGTRRAVAAFQRGRGLAVDGVAGPRTRRALGRRGRPAFGSRAVRVGAGGWDVAAVQFLLAHRGFPSGPVDGGFGARSQAALLRYQRWAGLTPDGVAGPATLRSLHRPAPRSPLTLRRPVASALGDRFGPRGDKLHSGLDFPAPAGTTVRAAHAGVVLSAGWDAGGYGNLVVVRHPSGLSTWYAHLSRLGVRTGAAVVAGTVVGAVGSTGFSTGPHLHFEARLRGAVLDPAPALG